MCGMFYFLNYTVQSEYYIFQVGTHRETDKNIFGKAVINVESLRSIEHK